MVFEKFRLGIIISSRLRMLRLILFGVLSCGLLNWTVVFAADFVCPDSRGQYPDAENCTTFYNCWDYAAIKQSCPDGLYFDPRTKSCNWASAVLCNSSASPTTPTPTEFTSVVPLVAAKLRRLPKAGSHASNLIEPICRSTSEYPNPCTKPRGTSADPKDCAAFYNCWDCDYIHSRCIDGLFYEAVSGTCVYPTAANCGSRPVLGSGAVNPNIPARTPINAYGQPVAPAGPTQPGYGGSGSLPMVPSNNYPVNQYGAPGDQTGVLAPGVGGSFVPVVPSNPLPRSDVPSGNYPTVPEGPAPGYGGAVPANPGAPVIPTGENPSPTVSIDPAPPVVPVANPPPAVPGYGNNIPSVPQPPVSATPTGGIPSQNQPQNPYASGGTVPVVPGPPASPSPVVPGYDGNVPSVTQQPPVPSVPVSSVPPIVPGYGAIDPSTPVIFPSTPASGYGVTQGPTGYGTDAPTNTPMTFSPYSTFAAYDPISTIPTLFPWGRSETTQSSVDPAYGGVVTTVSPVPPVPVNPGYGNPSQPSIPPVVPGGYGSPATDVPSVPPVVSGGGYGTPGVPDVPRSTVPPNTNGPANGYPPVSPQTTVIQDPTTNTVVYVTNNIETTILVTNRTRSSTPAPVGYLKLQNLQKPKSRFQCPAAASGEKYADPNECGAYITCMAGGGWVRSYCPSGSVFDENTNKCSDSWDTGVGCRMIKPETPVPKPKPAVTWERDGDLEREVGASPRPSHPHMFSPQEAATTKISTLPTAPSVVTYQHPDSDGQSFGKHAKAQLRAYRLKRSLDNEIDDKSFDCPEAQGLYPHESDCALFWSCGDGQLAYLQFCPKSQEKNNPVYFNYTEQRCEWARGGKCVNGKVVLTEHHDYPHLMPSTEPPSTKASTQENKPEESSFKCLLENGLFGHPFDCAKYYHCENWVLKTMRCEPGKLYSKDNKRCEEEENVKCGHGNIKPRAHKFHCPSKYGYFPDPLSCRRFYQCVDYKALNQICPGNLLWSESKKTCDWAQNVPCGTGFAHKEHFKCPRPDGKYNHPIQDGDYYECINSVPHLRHCPEAYTFIANLRMCLPNTLLATEDPSASTSPTTSSTRTTAVVPTTTVATSSTTVPVVAAPAASGNETSTGTTALHVTETTESTPSSPDTTSSTLVPEKTTTNGTLSREAENSTFSSTSASQSTAAASTTIPALESANTTFSPVATTGRPTEASNSSETPADISGTTASPSESTNPRDATPVADSTTVKTTIATESVASTPTTVDVSTSTGSPSTTAPENVTTDTTTTSTVPENITLLVIEAANFTTPNPTGVTDTSTAGANATSNAAESSSSPTTKVVAEASSTPAAEPSSSETSTSAASPSTTQLITDTSDTTSASATNSTAAAVTQVADVTETISTTVVVNATEPENSTTVASTTSQTSTVGTTEPTTSTFLSEVPPQEGSDGTTAAETTTLSPSTEAPFASTTLQSETSSDSSPDATSVATEPATQSTTSPVSGNSTAVPGISSSTTSATDVTVGASSASAGTEATPSPAFTVIVVGDVASTEPNASTTFGTSSSTSTTEATSWTLPPENTSSPEDNSTSDNTESTLLTDSPTPSEPSTMAATEHTVSSTEVSAVTFEVSTTTAGSINVSSSALPENVTSIEETTLLTTAAPKDSSTSDANGTTQNSTTESSSTSPGPTVTVQNSTIHTETATVETSVISAGGSVSISSNGTAVVISVKTSSDSEGSTTVSSTDSSKGVWDFSTITATPTGTPIVPITGEAKGILEHVETAAKLGSLRFAPYHRIKTGVS